MSERVIGEYYTQDSSGFCRVMYNSIEELFFIEYFDENNKRFYLEDFPNKSLHYVEDAAENWCLGIKKL